MGRISFYISRITECVGYWPRMHDSHPPHWYDLIWNKITTIKSRPPILIPSSESSQRGKQIRILCGVCIPLQYVFFLFFFFRGGLIPSEHGYQKATFISLLLYHRFGNPLKSLTTVNFKYFTFFSFYCICSLLQVGVKADQKHEAVKSW